MDYLPLAVTLSATAGGFVIGLLSGLGGIKKLNQTLNAKQYELDGWKREAKRLADDRDEYKAGVEHWIAEADRMADVIAGYQAKAPVRTTDGKFASKKAETTAKLQAYVASKKAVS